MTAPLPVEMSPGERDGAETRHDRGSWGELVFHTLAHVRLPEPGGSFEPAYVAWAAEHVAAEGRLAEEARALSVAVGGDPARGQRLQLVAWLFADAAQALRVSALGLEQLRASDVADARLLSQLQREPAVELELLRISCALEHRRWRALSSPRQDGALAQELARARQLAPALARLSVHEVPALWRRGRLYRDAVWVGSSAAGCGPGLQHVQWQALHEATLSEVVAWAPPDAEPRALERVALSLLAMRVRARASASQVEAHGRWRAHLAIEPASEVTAWESEVLERLQSA